ncbi:MAG: transporter substrate-binding domain-containing protein, partial [Oscillibacter sp.]
MKRLCAAIVAMLMLCSFTLPVLATDSNPFPFPQRTVRVAISPFPNFSEQNPDGSYSGILIDYIREIQKYTGWNVEYIYTTPSEAVGLLDNGEADLMGAMNKNAQTQALYNFAELSSGYAYSTITTKKFHTDYLPNDYDTFEDIKVGVFIRAKSRVEAFHQFCKANNLHLTPVYFDDAAAWEEAFATGAVDAQLTSSAKLRDDEKIIANFRQESYYFGVAKGNDDVLRELNHALGQINQINPHFDSNLYMKYFGADSDGEFSLSSAEKRFVREHPVLRITAAPDWRPISYTDENGHFRGISADVMDVLHQKTGFQLEYVPAESFRHALSLLESNQADLMVGATEDGLGNSHKNLAFSLPYLPIQTVILHQAGKNLQEIPSPVMACVYGFEYEVFSQARRQNYDTALAAIEAVKNGEADFTVISSLTADHYFLNNGKNGLVLVPVSNTIPTLSIALNTPANPTLLTILDRAIHSINSVEQQS